jgi:histidinol-phosphatase (PHP family)
MPIQCDYHMHTPLCKHADGPMEAYIERGIELGLREIGFSDHNPLPHGFSPTVRMEEKELDYYVNRVLELQFEYRGKIDVMLGLEIDYVEGLEDFLAKQIGRYPFDYIIGSVHYLDPHCTIGSWSRNFSGTREEHYARYATLIGQLARSGLCDIIGHLDVVKRNGLAPTCAISDALREIAKACVAIEINTAGYRHPELPEPQPYPALPFVKEAIELRIPLTVNSDAHAPEQVGLKFGEIEKFLRANGCRELARFENRRRAMYSLNGN